MQITQTTHERLVDMLTSLELTAISDQLDRLLSEAARQDLALPDALAMSKAASLEYSSWRRPRLSLARSMLEIPSD